MFEKKNNTSFLLANNSYTYLCVSLLNVIVAAGSWCGFSCLFHWHCPVFVFIFSFLAETIINPIAATQQSSQATAAAQRKKGENKPTGAKKKKVKEYLGLRCGRSVLIFVFSFFILDICRFCSTFLYLDLRFV